MAIDAGDVVIALAIAGGGYVVYRNLISPRIAQAREEIAKQQAMKQYADALHAKQAASGPASILSAAGAGFAIGGPPGAIVGAVVGTAVSGFTSPKVSEVALAQKSAFDAFAVGYRSPTAKSHGSGVALTNARLNVGNAAASDWCRHWGGNWIPVTGTENNYLNKALATARRLNPSLKG